MNADKRRFGKISRESAFIGVHPWLNISVWLVAVVLLVALYWPGLNTWFYQDDFGWLNVRRDIHGWSGLLPALFAPKAHGNMRPLSETGFFTLFSALFGMNPLPFRIWVFATQAASLWLLGDIVTRWTGRWWAALGAQAVWIANRGLAPAMCWTSIYNQVLCGFLLLLALWFLMRGSWRAQWAAFLLGLGALESAVVYPALGLAYAPKMWRRFLPMFGVSAAYAALHFAVAPSGGGVYGLHIDTALPATLWKYASLALGSHWWAVAPLSVAVLAAGAWFGPAWFLVTLAPYLPLRDHVMDYYLAVPAIGLAMTAGLALARTPRVAAAALVLYLAVSVPQSRHAAEWHLARSRTVEDLVLGVAEARRLEPVRPILLANIRPEVFQAGFMDLPFRAMGIERVYLAPGEERRMGTELARLFVLPQALALRERALVYDASGPVLRNVTSLYAPAWRPAPPRLVNAGDPIFEPYLQGNWLPARDGYRAMSGTAGMRLAAPRAGERLWLGVFGDSRAMRVRAGGVELHADAVEHAIGRSDYRYRVKAEGEVTVSVENPGRLVFGFAEVR